jgi:uncharacterized protein (DUF1800 family)
MSLALAAIAANRFGYGAKQQDLRVIAGDPRGWVKAQLTPERTPPAPLAALPACEDDLLAIARFYVAVRLSGPQADRTRARLDRQGVTSAMIAESEVDVQYRRAMRDRYIAAVGARFSMQIASERPVFERLSAFWANHFTVSTVKPQVMSLPHSFERDVIRPHAAGRFGDLLRASTQHPAMGLYLDNANSIGPNSVWARNPRRMPAAFGFGPGGRPRGLNENLAREVLELHTLGVGGGYSQADVRALAALITGWMFERPAPTAVFSDTKGTRSGAQLFQFVADAHEPNSQTLLGASFGDGLEGGVGALSMLARHPSTARHIATKLVRHFVNDAPPAACVARVERTFLASDGDIATTMAALIDSPEAWDETRAKFKRPDEFLVSALRAFGAREVQPNALVNAAEMLGQRTYFAPGPDGWSDMADAWLSADLVWKRLEWAQAFSERVARTDRPMMEVAQAALGPSFF